MNEEKRAKVDQISIDINDTLLSAIKLMDQTNTKLLIVNNNGSYRSLVSIGDIQRAILDQKSLESKINDILRKDVKVCHESDELETIRQRVFQYRSEYMPILSDAGKLVDVIFWEELFEDRHSYHKGELELPVVIMAGGQGTRLKPITNIIPKPLVPLGDKPMIEIIVDNFVNMGASEFYFSVNYKAEMIKTYFDNLENKTYNIDYFTEPKPLGTAGSLFLLKDKIDSTFFVSNCDIIIDQDYVEVYNYHKENNNELTLVAALKHYSIPYGTLEMGKNGSLKELREKPELTFMVNAGMYVIEPHLLHEIPENEFFHITHLMEQIKKRGGKVGVFPVSENSWFDVGEWKEYNKTQKLFQEKFLS